MTGSHAGQVALIPRIPHLYMTSSDGSQPFVLRRGQFPVKLALAMGINKAQGQTFGLAGCTCQLHASPMSSYM